jgi:hypothetical protein
MVLFHGRFTESSHFLAQPDQSPDKNAELAPL